MRPVHPKQPKGKKELTEAQADRRAEREAKAVAKRRAKYGIAPPSDSPYLDIPPHDYDRDLL
jgi:hypothetical protein